MQEKVLFIDRDGTIIVEPIEDKQVDSLEKLEFLPKAITALARIAQQNQYKLVMVTNQDGMGTASFPENTFWPAQEKMLRILENEGVIFENIHIDNSFEHENKPTRKPGVAMLQQYFNGKYDLANSYVIGDRITDILLAQNLGAKSIFISETSDVRAALTSMDWDAIATFLIQPARIATVHRKTNETDILIELNLDGQGVTEIDRKSVV